MNIAISMDPRWFPRAAETDRQARPFPCGICEPPTPPLTPFTERHLQCVWADDRLRPPNLATAAGERIEVEHPGEWNTGPGPDFLKAALRVGPDMRRITGDVEIHIRPADWQRHRHAEDPRYRRVCAHVTYYPGTLPDELEVSARTESGTIMAVRHRRLPIEAVQFHPESVLTEGGYQMLGNWLAACGDADAPARAAGLSPLIRTRRPPTS